MEFKNLLHVTTWCTENHLKVKTLACKKKKKEIKSCTD